jgi:predicted nicotinamide N-methyase
MPTDGSSRSHISATTARSIRAFIREHTRLRSSPLLPEIQLHLAVDIIDLWRRLEEMSGEGSTPLPYWAVAWVGGQAIGRYVLDHREEFSGRSVLDLAAGSGLCAISAALAGAASVVAADIDPYSQEATRLNAEANAVDVSFHLDDLLDSPPPEVDVVLAGDVCYEQLMADRVMHWLHSALGAGSRVLIADPGREHFTPRALTPLAAYDICVSHGVEDRDLKRCTVYSFR